MNSNPAATTDHSLWKLFKTNAHHVPWKGFLMGLFLPLTLLEIFIYFDKTLAGVFASLLWCVVFVVINYILTRSFCGFTVMTFIMISTRVLGGIFSGGHHFMVFVPAVDNLILGSLFLGSLLFPKPFVMLFLDEEKLKKIPQEIHRSSYYIKAWRTITAVWGIAYVIEAIIVACLTVMHFGIGNIVDFFFGWPTVLALLVFSVTYPGWYWTKNWPDIAKC